MTEKKRKFSRLAAPLALVAGMGAGYGTNEMAAQRFYDRVETIDAIAEVEATLSDSLSQLQRAAENPSNVFLGNIARKHIEDSRKKLVQVRRRMGVGRREQIEDNNR